MIHDRLAFAGTNYKPLLVMRDAWAIEASSALRKMAELKRAYDREQAAHTAAVAQAAQLGGNGNGNGDGPPPAKRMRVRSAQIHKERNPGSLTVKEGDTCTFLNAAINPKWSYVMMDDDGRMGVVSATKLEFLPPEEAMPDPSDSDDDDDTEPGAAEAAPAAAEPAADETAAAEEAAPAAE